MGKLDFITGAEKTLELLHCYGIREIHEKNVGSQKEKSELEKNTFEKS